MRPEPDRDPADGQAGESTECGRSAKRRGNRIGCGGYASESQALGVVETRVLQIGGKRAGNAVRHSRGIARAFGGGEDANEEALWRGDDADVVLYAGRGDAGDRGRSFNDTRRESEVDVRELELTRRRRADHGKRGFGAVWSGQQCDDHGGGNGAADTRTDECPEPAFA